MLDGRSEENPELVKEHKQQISGRKAPARRRGNRARRTMPRGKNRGRLPALKQEQNIEADRIFHGSGKAGGSRKN